MAGNSPLALLDIVNYKNTKRDEIKREMEKIF